MIKLVTFATNGTLKKKLNENQTKCCFTWKDENHNSCKPIEVTTNMTNTINGYKSVQS